MFIYPQVLAALGTVYFEHVLPDVIRNCSHQRASVRDGYLTLFKVKASFFFSSSLLPEAFASVALYNCCLVIDIYCSICQGH